MGQAARARAEERFSLAATAGAYAGLYREVVAEAHGNILGRRRA
jgi:glycosyltransferase involved in cell wall biosynthesis